MITSYRDLEQLRARLQSLARRGRPADAPELTDCFLSVLHRLESGDLSPGELAAREHVTPPSMNRTLNTLSSAGLIQRHRDGGDGRRVRVTLTPAGAEHARAARGHDADWFAERLRAFRDDERATIQQAVTVLAQLAEK